MIDKQESQFSATLMIDEEPVSMELWRISGGQEANLIGEDFSMLLRANDGLSLKNAVDKAWRFLQKAEL